MIDPKINPYTFNIILVSIGILLPIIISNLTIIALILYWVYNKNYKSLFINLLQNRIVFLLIGFYFIYLIGLVYTNNVNHGLFQLEKKLGFLVFPLFLSSYNQKINIKKYSILFIFAVCTILCSLFLIAYASIRYLYDPQLEYFFYRQLTEVINIHPVYFSVYILFSISIIALELKIKKKWLLLVLVIFYGFLILLLLSSKIVIVLSVPLLFYILKLNLKHAIPIFIIFLLGISSFNYTKSRFNEIIYSQWDIVTKNNFAYNEKFTGITLRLVQWKIVLSQFFKDDLYIFGVGTGDSQDYINKIYSNHGLDSGGYLNYNLHNQYLDIFIKLGLFGLICFLSILFISFKIAINRKDILFFSFLLIFSVVCLTESMLGLNKGIIFFSFFLSFFLFVRTEKSKI